MATRNINVVISKKSEKELKKAIDKIDSMDASLKSLKLDKKNVDGVMVSVLKISVDV